MNGHTGRVRAFSYLGNEQLASGSRDATIKIWDLNTGLCVKTLFGHTDYILSLAKLKENSLIASGSADLTIKIWNTTF